MRRAPAVRTLSATLFALALLGLAACSNDELTAPEEPIEGTLTIDASTGWAFASLSGQQAVTVADPATSAAWDIGFNATGVMLNGGAAGPGGTNGHCLCQNVGATDQQILAMTAQSEEADFTGVTAVPAGVQFESEQLVPAVAGWYTGSGAAAAAAPGNTWLVRLNNGTSFAKVRVTALAGTTASHAGQVTVEYAVQPSSADPFGPTRTATLSAATATSFDLNTDATTTGADWDLRLEGFVLRLNGGVSGAGSAAATPPTTTPFADITTASVAPQAYRTDAFGGVFKAHPWYKYNIQGDHVISPTFEVYLLKRGDDVYKIQLLNYYGPAGETRRITFRYAKLAD